MAISVRRKATAFVLAVGLLTAIAGRPTGAEELTNPKSLPFLIVDLDGDGVDLIPLNESSVEFDVDGDGWAEKTAWIKPDDGFLSVMSRDEDRSLHTIRERILAFFVNAKEKTSGHDRNKDGLYNSEDFLELPRGKTFNELGFSIARDKKLTGIPNTRGKYLIPCKFKEYSFLKNSQMTIACVDGTTYPVYEVRFDYQDTNAIWKTMCEQIEGNPKERQEYFTYCLNAPEAISQKGIKNG